MKPHRSSLLFFLLIIFFSLANAEALPAHLERSLPKTYGLDNKKGWISGALDQSNSPYYVLLDSNNDKEGIELLKIYVFVVDDKNKLKKMASSKAWLGGGRQIADVSVKNNSIFLVIHSSGGCCSHSGTEYQFKKIDEDIVLIGLQEHSVGSILGGAASKKNMFYESGQSVNFLTNETIIWRKTGPEVRLWENENSFKPSWLPYKLKNKTRANEIKLPFSSNKTWMLMDFDPDEYDEWARQIKNLCAYYDDSFKLKQCS